MQSNAGVVSRRNSRAIEHRRADVDSKIGTELRGTAEQALQIDSSPGRELEHSRRRANTLCEERIELGLSLRAAPERTDRIVDACDSSVERAGPPRLPSLARSRRLGQSRYSLRYPPRRITDRRSAALNSAADSAEPEKVDAKRYNGHLNRAIQRPLHRLVMRRFATALTRTHVEIDLHDVPSHAAQQFGSAAAHLRRPLKPIASWYPFSSARRTLYPSPPC